MVDPVAEWVDTGQSETESESTELTIYISMGDSVKFHWSLELFFGWLCKLLFIPRIILIPNTAYYSGNYSRTIGSGLDPDNAHCTVSGYMYYQTVHWEGRHFASITTEPLHGWLAVELYFCIQGVSLPQTLQSQLWLRPAFLAVWALTTLRPSLDCAAFQLLTVDCTFTEEFTTPPHP